VATNAAPLRVCLDARLVSGERGGVEQVIIGLAGAFSKLNDGDEEYLFLVNPGQSGWLEPSIGGPCRLLPGGKTEIAGAAGGARGLARRALKAAVPAGVREAIRGRVRREPLVPPSDGTIEEAGVRVMHFPIQVGFRTNVPTVFMPHDLQHLHLPQFFSPGEVAAREARYRALCEQASIVALMSSWGRDDVMSRYALPPAKMLVVPGAAVVGVSPGDARDGRAIAEHLGVAGPFALYPARCWPHKNHLRLLEALALLRRKGLEIPLVLTGSQEGLDGPVVAAIQTLGLQDLVLFTGFVSPAELAGLYLAARLLAFPSLFEGWGLPVLEAMNAGLPVVCSNVTCLPAIAGDAAVICDPWSVESIADSIARAWQDEALRERLAEAGRARAAQFSWDRSARILRACYRKLAGRELSEADRAVLAAPPIV
jgi:glycosyltransferase involved in cell wall biosynthesis